MERGVITELKGVKSLDSILAQVRDERKGNTDALLRDPAGFRVEIIPGSLTGYGLALNGKLVPFDKSGIESLCKLLKMDFRYFSKYPRKEEFVEHVTTLMPHVMRENSGALVRLDKDGGIRAVLPGNYTILDDDQLLNLVGQMGHQTLKQVKGIVVGSSSDSGSIYRLLFGDSALSRDEIYPTLNIRHNEVGGALNVAFGTLRIRCLNGSVDPTDTGTILNWGHRGNFDAKVTSLGAAMRNATGWVGPMIEAIKRSQDKVLTVPSEEINRLHRAGWISPDFKDSAKACLDEQLRSGERFGADHGSSKYGVFNAMTEACKGYTAKERSRWELVAHKYLLSK